MPALAAASGSREASGSRGPAGSLGARAARRQGAPRAGLPRLCLAATLGLLGSVTLGALSPLLCEELRRQAAARLARTLLACLGLRVRLRGRLAPGPAVYVFNHTSALDLLVLAALGIPRARFFLSESAGAAAAPLRWLADSLGAFWLPPQREQAERRRRFARASRELGLRGESVVLSPEGRRVRTGGLGPLNRGAFHLAIALGRPLIPLRVEIPPVCDLDSGILAARGGAVEVWVQGALRAQALEDLERLRAQAAASLTRARPPLPPARLGVDPTDRPLEAGAEAASQREGRRAS